MTKSLTKKKIIKNEIKNFQWRKRKSAYQKKNKKYSKKFWKKFFKSMKILFL